METSIWGESILGRGFTSLPKWNSLSGFPKSLVRTSKLLSTVEKIVQQLPSSSFLTWHWLTPSSQPPRKRPTRLAESSIMSYSSLSSVTAISSWLSECSLNEHGVWRYGQLLKVQVRTCAVQQKCKVSHNCDLQFPHSNFGEVKEADEIVIFKYFNMINIKLLMRYFSFFSF